MKDTAAGYLRAPELQVGDEAARAFDALLADAASGDGVVRYDLPEPKHVFLRYLAERRGFLLHGSSRDDIERFEPRSNDDYMGRPGVRVYASCDGIWPVFFALIGRADLKGSFWNACYVVPGADGSEQRYYRFSIARDVERERVWTPGTVYVLDREGFEPVRAPDGTPLQEWACEQPATPVARVRVDPSDFPYAADVRAHDSSELDRLEELAAGRIGPHIVSIEQTRDGCMLRLADAGMPHDELLELAALVERYLPLAAEVEPDPLALRVSGDVPPELVRLELANLLTGNSGA